MSYGNISATLSDADKNAVKLKVQEALVLLPFLINLSPEERQSIPKMGNNRTTFVREFFQMAQNNQGVFPPYFDLTELSKDLALFSALRDILIPIRQLLEKVEDTYMAVSSEAYLAALQGRELLVAANRNNPGLDVLVAQLDEYFQRTSADNTPPTPPTP